MKHTLILVALLAFTTARADQKFDHDSIAAMAGCYEVTFHFQETGTTDPKYPTHSPEYNEHGLEWIALDQDQADLVSLQHILITPNGPLKHWRQEWQFQPLNQLKFIGNNTWNMINLNATDVAGKWIQRTFQVDDSPRYECVASFTKDASGFGSWECSTFAPLPRREFSQRSDYTILDRTNQHLITADGWLHIQHNRKVLAATVMGTTVYTQIATEEGLDTYKRVDEARCLDAQKFWSENKSVWHEIQAMWAHIRGHHPDFTLLGKVNGKVLWENLFDLADAAVEEIRTEGTLDLKLFKQKAHDLIHQYMVMPEEPEHSVR